MNELYIAVWFPPPVVELTSLWSLSKSGEVRREAIASLNTWSRSRSAMLRVRFSARAYGVEKLLYGLVGWRDVIDL